MTTLTSTELKTRARLTDELYFISDRNETVRFGLVETEDGNARQWQVERDGEIIRWGSWNYTSNIAAADDYLRTREQDDVMDRALAALDALRWAC